MTLRDFHCLSEPGKDEVICLKGDPVKEKLIAGYKIVLYKVDDFFVEVYYDIKKDSIHKFKGCSRSDLLYHG